MTANDKEPTKYWLSTLPDTTSLKDLAKIAKHRWIIERDYEELKQELGLGHYEGRGWRGFHHHATLSIAAYGFLSAEQLTTGRRVGSKKNFIQRQVPALPSNYVARGSPARARRISSRRCLEPRSLTQSGNNATPRWAAAVTFFTST